MDIATSYDIISDMRKNLKSDVQMLKMLQPNMYVSNVNKIDLERLKAEGIRALILDLDNTLLPWRDRQAKSFLASTLRRLTENGFRLCILSNTRDDSVRELFEPLNIPCISRAGKPRKSAFRRALEVLGTTTEDTGVVGDQMFTDVLGGNRAGLFTILVVPISRREFIGTKLARGIEGKILKYFIKKGRLDNPRY